MKTQVLLPMSRGNLLPVGSFLAAWSFLMDDALLGVVRDRL